MKRVRIELKLLEDLHAGSGTGSGDIDALLARDRDEEPVLRASHVKGVWRDATDLAIEETLFGASRKAGGQLSLTSFYAVQAPEELRWSSTSFQAGSRVPQEDTLRTRQFIAAGSEFAASAWLPEILEPAFKRVVGRCDAFGARRRRGDGVVTITSWQVQDCQPGDIQGEPTGTAPVLRVLLRAEDPLCLPLTGFPGNILPSECYIRGQQLLGGIAKALLDAERFAEAGEWLSRKVRIGNAYPLPDPAERDGRAVPENWGDWTVLPIPLSFQRGKPVGSGAGFPWWAPAPESGGTDAKTVNIIDKFGGEPSPEAAHHLPENDKKADPDRKPTDKPKRPGDREFLFQKKSDEPWRLFAAPLRQRMRNALPRSPDDPGSLFTQEEIPERTLFLADIRFPDFEIAKRLATSLEPYIGPRSACINLGRGGAPVVIEKAQWRQASTSSAVSPRDAPQRLEILLISDLIARDRRLAFLENLDAASVARLCGLEAHQIGRMEFIKKTESVADTVEVHGFNALTGLPRIPALALRRGSCWRFEAEDESQKESLALLKEALEKRLEDGLGERRSEGFGRFLLDFHDLISAGAIERHARPAATIPSNPLERAIDAAREAWEGYRARCALEKIPRLVHWQRLRAIAQRNAQSLKPAVEELLRNNTDEKGDLGQWARWLLQKFDKQEPEGDANGLAEFYRQLSRFACLELRATGEIG